MAGLGIAVLSVAAIVAHCSGNVLFKRLIPSDDPVYEQYEQKGEVGWGVSLARCAAAAKLAANATDANAFRHAAQNGTCDYGTVPAEALEGAKKTKYTRDPAGIYVILE